MAQIGITHDFLKKMSTGVSEGRQLYDMLVEIVGAVREGTKIQVSDAIWERALKAVAFEDTHADLQLDALQSGLLPLKPSNPTAILTDCCSDHKRIVSFRLTNKLSIVYTIESIVYNK